MRLGSHSLLVRAAVPGIGHRLPIKCASNRRTRQTRSSNWRRRLPKDRGLRRFFSVVIVCRIARGHALRIVAVEQFVAGETVAKVGKRGLSVERRGSACARLTGASPILTKNLNRSHVTRPLSGRAKAGTRKSSWTMRHACGAIAGDEPRQQRARGCARITACAGGHKGLKPNDQGATCEVLAA